MNPECMGGPQTQKNPAECCPMPKMIDESIIAKCDQEFPTSMPPSPAGKMNGCCFSECILNSTNILVNSAVDKAAAIKILTANADATWVPIITAAIDKCQADGQYSLEFNRLTFFKYTTL